MSFVTFPNSGFLAARRLHGPPQRTIIQSEFHEVVCALQLFVFSISFVVYALIFSSFVLIVLLPVEFSIKWFENVLSTCIGLKYMYINNDKISWLLLTVHGTFAGFSFSWLGVVENDGDVRPIECARKFNSDILFIVSYAPKRSCIAAIEMKRRKYCTINLALASELTKTVYFRFHCILRVSSSASLWPHVCAISQRTNENPKIPSPNGSHRHFNAFVEMKYRN